MEHKCVNALYPEFKIWKQFVHKVFNSALHLDSLKSSHPIEVAVSNPDEIEEIFDDISYAKGASIIRMLAHYIGEEVKSCYVYNYVYSINFMRRNWITPQTTFKKKLVII